VVSAPPLGDEPVPPPGPRAVEKVEMMNVGKMRRHLRRSVPPPKPVSMIMCPSCGEWLPADDHVFGSLTWPPHDCVPRDSAEVWRRFCDGP
jgi:hypothetical protein